MRLDVLVIFNIQLCLLLMLLAPLISCIQKKLPLIPSALFVIALCLIAFPLNRFWINPYISPLLYLPFPVPSIASSIPAFHMKENNVLRFLWYIYGTGAILTAIYTIISHGLFRRRIRLNQLVCPQHIMTIAESTFRKKLHEQLLDKCKRKGRSPKEKELLKIQRYRLPRIVISSSISTPGVILTAPSCILLDRADYSDEQLESIFFYAFHCLNTIHFMSRWCMILFRPICWFNPIFWFSHRILHTDESLFIENSLFDTASETAERQNPAFYEAKRAAHEKLLDAITFKSSPCRHIFSLGGKLHQIERRKKSLRQNIPYFLTLYFFSIYLIFILVIPLLIQPYGGCPVNEQSIFSVLGADAVQLDSSIGFNDSVKLSSTEKDGLLYGSGSVYAQTKHELSISHISLTYSPEQNTALESDIRRLYDALCERLGDSQTPFCGIHSRTSHIWIATDNNDENIRILMNIIPVPSGNYHKARLDVTICLE